MVARFVITLLLVLAGCFRGVTAAYMDLYPTVSISEFPVIGIPFTIEVNVHNGDVPFTFVEQPGASSVVLEFQLPPQLEYVSCAVSPVEMAPFAANWASPATVTNNGGNLRCELG